MVRIPSGMPARLIGHCGELKLKANIFQRISQTPAQTQRSYLSPVPKPHLSTTIPHNMQDNPVIVRIAIVPVTSPVTRLRVKLDITRKPLTPGI
jgi:hypothetical protein